MARNVKALEIATTIFWSGRKGDHVAIYRARANNPWQGREQGSHAPEIKACCQQDGALNQHQPLPAHSTGKSELSASIPFSYQQKQVNRLHSQQPHHGHNPASSN